MRLDPPFTPTVSGVDPSGMPTITRNPLAYTRSATGFSQAMALAQQNTSSQSIPYQPKAGSLLPESSATPWSVQVQAGQTLSGIVREQMAARGVSISSSEALRLSQNIAQANKLPNANLIHPGQRINLESLNLTIAQAQMANRAVVASANLGQTPTPTNISSGVNKQSLVKGTTQLQLQSRVDQGSNPVLEKTLNRAVDKGFIPAQDKQAVMHKIIQLSQQHRFAPDDFARLSLMESDGLNPKANNSRCFGIIQFCDGPDRGAASVGYAANPKAIMGRSVLDQLDLVGKYFEDTGLKTYGPVGLDDLYLTVLTPAARNETRPNAALNIPGPQAAFLHVNRDTRAPITRNSILAGLHQNANERLGVEVAQRPSLQAARISAYAEQAVVTQFE
ncbi:MAG: LysM peptidoglycan-binding domain-containing protein [Burkholderiales bacterium]|nr:LysM peptidoglycan-binding domain-containing protein [Burkholderiales bacterium]